MIFRQYFNVKTAIDGLAAGGMQASRVCRGRVFGATACLVCRPQAHLATPVSYGRGDAPRSWTSIIVWHEWEFIAPAAPRPARRPSAKISSVQLVPRRQSEVSAGRCPRWMTPGTRRACPKNRTLRPRAHRPWFEIQLPRCADDARRRDLWSPGRGRSGLQPAAGNILLVPF
jgi:hypothetical protein